MRSTEGRLMSSCGRPVASILCSALLLSSVQGCDWTIEPWIEFDGVATRVTTSVDGIPTGWQLNGTKLVTRTFRHDCLDQTLTASQHCAPGMCERVAQARLSGSCDESRAVPDAIVQLGGRTTVLGARASGDRRLQWTLRDEWTITADADAGEPRAESTAMYTLQCPGEFNSDATAMVSTRRWRAAPLALGEELQLIAKKRILIRNACNASAPWFHVAVNVNLT